LNNETTGRIATLGTGKKRFSSLLRSVREEKRKTRKRRKCADETCREEKDCTKWCREHLNNLVQEVSVSQDENSITLTKVSKMEGEVNWYNRKGKLFTLYDLELGLDYTGKKGDEVVTGVVKVQNYEQDCESDATFRVTVGSGPNEQAWKIWAREAVKAKFLEVWSRLIVALHDDQKEKAPQLAKVSSGTVKLPEMVQKSFPKEAPKKSSSVGSISLSYTFQASVQDIWDMFVNQQKMQHFTQSKVMADAKEGGFFQLYDGVITGCYTELKPNTEMKFAWRLKDWKEGHNSIVTVKFVKSSSGTKLDLVQTNVPADELERTKIGWGKYYFERWRGIFGYSYN
jgi:activator of HSP90 ATPase